MNYRKIVAIAAMALSIPIITRVSGPAMAANSDDRIVPYDSNDRGWDISVFRRNNECSMARVYNRGTFLMVKYDRDYGSYYLGMRREDWGDLIVHDAVYTMNIVTDRMRWRGKMIGHTDSDGGGFSMRNLKRDFIIDLAMSNWIQFFTDGKSLRRLTLDGSYDALMRLGACQRDMGW